MKKRVYYFCQKDNVKNADYFKRQLFLKKSWKKLLKLFCYYLEIIYNIATGDSNSCKDPTKLRINHNESKLSLADDLLNFKLRFAKYLSHNWKVWNNHIVSYEGALKGWLKAELHWN